MLRRTMILTALVAAPLAGLVGGMIEKMMIRYVIYSFSRPYLLSFSTIQPSKMTFFLSFESP